MKLLLVLVLSSIINVSITNAQSADYGGGLSYKVLGVDHGSTLGLPRFGGGVELGYTGFVNPSFSWGLTGRLASVNVPASESNTSAKLGSKMTSLDATAIYQLANGYIFHDNAKFSPYLLGGLGWNYYTQMEKQNSDLQLPLGLGLNVSIVRDIKLQLQSEYRVSLLADRSNWVSGLGVQFMLDKCHKPTPPVVIEIPVMQPEKDTDADGIIDHLDKCPYTPGIPALQGCPEISVAIVEVLTRARYIQFETASANLKAEAYPVLDEVVTIMKNNPSYHLHIQGHTDSKGSSASNHTLSHNRANSAYNYLISKGIDASRLEASGFGEDSPIDTNSTEEGRALNRRVEFIVH